MEEGTEDLRKELLAAGAVSFEDEADEGISLQDILTLKERFDSADIDGGGSLDMQEFMDAFGSILNKDGSLTREQIRRLFMQIDANSDGVVDWNEFSTYMLMESQMSGSLVSEKISKFFISDTSGLKQDDENSHNEHVDCLVIEPSGPSYITSSKDGTIRIWSQASLTLQKTISLGKTWVLALCLLRHAAKLVLSTDDRKIKVFDVHTWEQSVEVELSGQAYCLCSWRKDDTEYIAYGNEVGDVTVVDYEKGVRDFRNDHSMRKGKRRASNWAVSWTRNIHSGWINQISMIEDLGGLVTCSTDGAINIFEFPFQNDPVKKDKVLMKRVLTPQYKVNQKPIKCFVWVESLKLIVSGGMERELTVWNPYTSKPVTKLEGHMSGIIMLQVNSDYDQVISLSKDKVVKVWDLRNGEGLQTLSHFKNPALRPTAILFDQARGRLITWGCRHHIWKINPQITNPVNDETHNTPVVAVLYNRIFGSVVTVAEDSETIVWRPLTGQQISSFHDPDRTPETFVSCASFDEAGRRLMTGDHEGRVQVWNFSNGACIKTLLKPVDKHSRQEVTAVTSYSFEEKRYIAAASWDRKVTIWLDKSEDAGSVYPLIQMLGNESDILSIAFSYPKTLATGASDGSIAIFDIESGIKRIAMQSQKIHGFTPRESMNAKELANTLYVEKILFLEEKNKTILTSGADGHLRFWEGTWMTILPESASTTGTNKVVLLMPAEHWPEYGLVDHQVDEDNNILLTADEGGFVKVWDISEYQWNMPDRSQVKACYFWRAHQISISAVDVIVPEQDPGNELNPLVLTASKDKSVLLWTIDGIKIGEFGKNVELKADAWNLFDTSTWLTDKSINILGMDYDYDSDRNDDSQSSNDDIEHVLKGLDERKSPSLPSLLLPDDPFSGSGRASPPLLSAPSSPT
uniref:EF-hand domain-containing protein n=1 Tax=Guillardia theta TaxID=55529 RepID=A0A6U6E0C0_GUITH|mmetsp:Transcript_8811/g.29421  ORF Transcript_8811/g.29421 Transcript_8811/m.29421 type:complete len:914 (+) Transcript_8811:493-3234(+)